MKLYIPTESEFRETFKLDDDYKIPLATRKQYSKYVIGSYNLYNELKQFPDKKPMVIYYNSKRERIVVYVEESRGWQNFVNPLGSRMTLECSYVSGGIRENGRPDTKPFWTYTKFDNPAQVAYIAYDSLEQVLNTIKSKYQSKYRLELIWRNMAQTYGLYKSVSFMNPIWLDGCKFMNKLEIRKNGRSEFIGDYQIKQTITNRTDIWNGDVLPLVKKIIGRTENRF